jgi:hypothetical protein
MVRGQPAPGEETSNVSTKRRILAAASIAASATLALTGVGQTAANATTSLKTITVTMTAKSVTLSSGARLHAGRYIFKVVRPGGDDNLQLARLAPGYSLAQAKKDLGVAFNGNIPAIRRVDKNIHFYGGVDGSGSHAGFFAETLYAGTYLFTEQNGNAITFVHVFGTPPQGQGWVNQTSTLSAVKPNRWAVPASIPHSGWTMFRNVAAEPHFIVLQQVKPETTYRELLAALKSTSQSPPAFALSGGTSTSVISPNTQMLFHYSLPPGKYALMCFWPDDMTGMPHALMGMYKFITLK